MPDLIIIRGLPGTGKSAGKEYARAKGLAWIDHDSLVYDFNQKEKPGEKDLEAAWKNLLSVAFNYMQLGRGMVVAGVLAKRSAKDPLDVKSLGVMGVSKGYVVKKVLFTADEKARGKRITCTRKEPATLTKGLTATEGEKTVDTTKLTPAQTMVALKKAISGK